MPVSELMKDGKAREKVDPTLRMKEMSENRGTIPGEAVYGYL